ncbi:MAG: FAD binding domain-containing protein [Alkalispirochaeta sp.]
MIPFELTFRRAETVDEAVGAWVEATNAGQTALYYGGGTEIVTLARDNKRPADVLIDYKRIPDTWVCGIDGDDADTWWVGSAVRLNTVVDTPRTGLIACCLSGVADRTVRNSITLGGNICGMLPYREGVLPFLLLDGTVTYAHPVDGGESEVATKPINDLFHKKLKLPKGGLVLSFGIEAHLLADVGLDQAPSGTAVPGEEGLDHEPGIGLHTGSGGYSVAAPYGPLTAVGSGPRGKWFYRRHTKEPRVDYPLVTVAMAVVSGSVRVAVAGAWGYPVRADRVEDALNATGMDAIVAMDETDRRGEIKRAVDAQEIQFKQDMRGSRRYRRELTIQAIEDGVLALTGDQSGGTE